MYLKSSMIQQNFKYSILLVIAAAAVIVGNGIHARVTVRKEYALSA